jgi:hypothetical protein
VPPPLAQLYRWDGRTLGRTLGKTYGIKARCYWERPWGTHWVPREHVENLMRTHWQLERNMLGTKEKRKKSPPLSKTPTPSLKLCILVVVGLCLAKEFQWRVIETGIWKIFLESLVLSSMDQCKDNWRNICLIFKPNYFIFSLIIAFKINLKNNSLTFPNNYLHFITTSLFSSIHQHGHEK